MGNGGSVGNAQMAVVNATERLQRAAIYNFSGAYGNNDGEVVSASVVALDSLVGLLGAATVSDLVAVYAGQQPGLRAVPGMVGYTGAPHAAGRTLNAGDTIPSELTGCTWDGNVLRVNADDVTIADWRLNCGIDCYAATKLTVTNCVIDVPSGNSFYGVLVRNGADLHISDSTVGGAGDATTFGQTVSVETGGALYATRCDLSGFQDAAGLSDGVLSQCYIHDIALASTYHSDGVQIFGGGVRAIVQHCYIDIRSPDGSNTDLSHQNACVYTDLPTGPAGGVVINDNYLSGGTYFIMLSGGAPAVVITNNKFGPLDATGLGEYTINPPATVAMWDGNTHVDGSPAPLV